MRSKHLVLEKTWVLALGLAGLIGGALLIAALVRATNDSIFFCSSVRAKSKNIAEYSATPIQLRAIIHYATSNIVPQQSFSEISVSFDVLKVKAPCNFLVFGLGHDSLMWTSLNPGGNTVFLEEDPEWIQSVLQTSPILRAHHVRYRTRLDQADKLLKSYKSEPDCLPGNAYLRDNDDCKLALTGLPDEFYETEWDLIMIDAPKGYAASHPGRIGAIFSAAVMARNRKGDGVTHVFLHDVDRKVEKSYGTEFLCQKYLVKGEGRLWHFEIPAVANRTDDGGSANSFC